MKTELLNEELVCLIAPDGTPQTMFLAPDVPSCIGLMRMLHEAGLSESFHVLNLNGFRILPVKAIITQTGTEKEGYEAAMNKIKKLKEDKS